MPAIRGVPHPFPYQGSKRQLATQILSLIPEGTSRIHEPFLGSGAISIASAYTGKAEFFFLSDSHTPLARLWRAIIHRPHKLSDGYESLWQEQLGSEREFYDKVRARFNTSHEPECFLYLLARCVKAAIRYNGKGEFNNSPDNRRLGMNPDTMRANIRNTSELFRGRCEISSRDYRQTLDSIEQGDVVYLDPPYQGVCNTRDHRYHSGILFDEFVEYLQELNNRRALFIVSYDGRTGERSHGRELPRHLQATRLEVPVGRSSQSTLLGRSELTVESLYVSHDLEALALALDTRLRAEDESLFSASI